MIYFHFFYNIIIMKRFSDVRKIKIFGDIINRNENFLLPNSLLEGTLIDDNIQYPTQFFISNSNLKENENANNKQLIKSNRTYSQLMEIPDLSLPLTDILNIYDIDTYDELIDLIKKLLFNNTSEYTIFRLVNTYTRIYYDDLKKTNNSLIKMFKLIFNNEATSHSEISNYKINDDKLSSFINKWFRKNNKDNFNLNICEDIKNFLSNKYES
jgi:hypothetical protein